MFEKQFKKITEWIICGCWLTAWRDISEVATESLGNLRYTMSQPTSATIPLKEDQRSSFRGHSIVPSNSW